MIWERSHRLEPSRVDDVRQSAFSGDTSSSEHGIDEQVIGVTSNIPHVESEQVIVDDEFSLGRERLRVVIGNHQFLRLVVKEGLVKRDQCKHGLWLEWARLTV